MLRIYLNIAKMIVVGNGATQRTLLKARFVIFRCQKYVKKRYIEMTKKIYLEPLKGCAGSLHLPLLMCGTRIKTSFILLYIYIYVIQWMYFLFRLYRFPIERFMLTQKQNGQLIYLISEFTNRFASQFFSNFLGRLTLIGFL